MHQKVLDGAELLDEFLGGLLPHPRATGNVVGGVAHQSQHVDDLEAIGEPVFCLHLFGAEEFGVLLAHAGAVHPHLRRHQLGVVLVGGHHEGVDALAVGLPGQCADDVVGLVSTDLQDGDVVGFQNLFNVGNGRANGLGRLFALGFVLGVRFVAEGGPRGVERHAQVGWPFLFEHLLQCVHETHDG